MKRTKHSLSNFKLTTFNMGQLVPVGCFEVIPGDTFQHQTSALLRTVPLNFPVMHPVDVHMASFFVPNRLLWDANTDAAPNDKGWEAFITGGSDGNDAQTVPVITTNGSNNVKGSLLDYLGVPTGVNTFDVNALPIRAHNKIYNEYFRDQDLDSEISQDTTDVQRVSWRKDYFTSARPWEQKGTAVQVALANTQIQVTSSGTGVPKFDGSVDGTGRHLVADADPSTNLSSNNADLEGDLSWNDPELQVDLTGVNAIDIDEMRLALATQRYMENRAMYGSRYTEYLAFLGINSGDARLNRPEYLGGGRQTISFSEVLNTAATASNDLGEFGGHGIAAMRGNRYRRFFPEHGWVITLMWVRPMNMYVDALHKKWLRSDKEDFYQKELELIGQEPIANAEVYMGHSSPTGVFGYGDRNRSYTEEPSTVHGDFRDSTLNIAHFARDLTSDPSLNSTFIKCNPSTNPYTVSTDDTLWVMVQHNLKARRMPRRNPRPRTF